MVPRRQSGSRQSCANRYSSFRSSSRRRVSLRTFSPFTRVSRARFPPLKSLFPFAANFFQTFFFILKVLNVFLSPRRHGFQQLNIIILLLVRAAVLLGFLQCGEGQAQFGRPCWCSKPQSDRALGPRL